MIGEGRQFNSAPTHWKRKRMEIFASAIIVTVIVVITELKNKLKKKAKGLV